MAAILDRIQFNSVGGLGMADFISVNEAANILDVSPRAVTRWCKTGRIEGAEKLNDGPTSSWVIPKDGFAKFKAEREKALQKRFKGKRKK